MVHPRKQWGGALQGSVDSQCLCWEAGGTARWPSCQAGKQPAGSQPAERLTGINPFLHNAIWDAGELQGGRAVSLGWARAPSFAYIHTGLGPERAGQ